MINCAVTNDSNVASNLHERGAGVGMNFTDEQMKTVVHHLGMVKKQLCLAYLQLQTGLVEDQRRFANSMIAPQIAMLDLVSLIVEPIKVEKVECNVPTRSSHGVQFLPETESHGLSGLLST